MQKEAVLQAKELTKVFEHPVPTQILKGLSLCVDRGETVAIMGTSGEGKTTLLHILGTLESASSGEISIAGRPLSQNKRSELLNRHIGFIFQSFHLLEDYTVIENVLMPARIGRRATGPGSEAYQRAQALLEEVGLTHRLEHMTKLLSGGEKQRVAIARALCNDPDLILADEPTGNLDHENSAKIADLLFSVVQRDPRKAMVIVTHDPKLAANCDRTLILRDGKLVSK